MKSFWGSVDRFFCRGICVQVLYLMFPVRCVSNKKCVGTYSLPVLLTEAFALPDTEERATQKPTHGYGVCSGRCRSYYNPYT